MVQYGHTNSANERGIRMKKAIIGKRILATLLATLMILGIGTAASAAPANAPEALSGGAVSVVKDQSANTLAVTQQEATPPPNATALTLNVAANVDIPAWNEEVDEPNGVWFKFTAPADGYYSFKSEGGTWDETLVDHNGEETGIPGNDPTANLYDSDMDWLDGNDDFRSADFAVFCSLEKDETVYLLAGCYNSIGAKYTVTVSTYDPVLKLKKNEISVNFHELVDIDALLEGSGWSADDVFIYRDNPCLDGYWGFIYGAKRGTGTLSIEAPDGSTAEVTVHVNYSFSQWLCVIFLGGWAWMEYTLIGPFSLADNIAALLEYGIGDAISDLLRGWGWNIG